MISFCKCNEEITNTQGDDKEPELGIYEKDISNEYKTLTNNSTNVDQEAQENNQKNTNTTENQGQKANAGKTGNLRTVNGTDSNVTVIMNASNNELGGSDLYS